MQITPLILSQLPIKRRGLTEFTYSRFLVPYLCDFKGKALFLDADMVVVGDIAELFKTEDMSAVCVMQGQPKFEWASAMLFNCGACLKLTPEFIDDEKNALLDLAWAPYVGNIPPEWNHCVGYQDTKPAELHHFTMGIPCWPETKGNPEDEWWDMEFKAMVHTVSWRELMGTSVHAKPTLQKFLGNKYGLKIT